jgi:hypothetical protein
MPKALVKCYVKGLLKNKQLWIFGIALTFFWLIIGAFELTQGIPNASTAANTVASSWFGLIGMFSLSAIAISIVYTIYHASASLTYSFKYTKLTPKIYVGTLIGSASIIGLILSVIMLFGTSGLFSAHFGLSVVPSNPLGAVGISVLAGVFMMSLAMLLVLVSVNYLGLRSVTLVMYLPFALAAGLGDTQMYSAIPLTFLYASPFNAISSLLYQTYSGTNVYAQFYNPATPALQWPILLVTLAVWIVALLAIDIALLGHLRPKQAEEGRQI